MPFTDAVLRCLARPFDLSGRAGRHEFRHFLCFCLAAWSALALLSGISGGPVVGMAGGLILLPPLAAAAVRRLHDTGLEGGWLLLGLVPVAGQAALLWLLTRPGENAPNRFGRNPRTALIYAAA